MAALGTLFMFVGFPLWMLSLTTETGISARHGFHSIFSAVGQTAEDASLKASLWVARKAEEIFDDFEMGHLMFDVAHHTLLTGGGHH